MTVARLRAALQRIANMESEVRGLASHFYGHAIEIAKKALAQKMSATSEKPTKEA